MNTAIAELAIRPVGFRTAHRLFRLHLPFVATDFAAVFLASITAVLVRAQWGPGVDLTFYLKLSLFIAVFLVTFGLLGLYPGLGLHPVSELQRVARGCSLSFLLIGTSTFFMRDAEAYSRMVIALAWPLSIITVAAARVFLRQYLSGTAWWGEQVIVLGAGAPGLLAVDTLRRFATLGLRPLAVLGDPEAGRAPAAAATEYSGPLDLAPRLAERHDIRYAVVAMPHLDSQELAQTVERYCASFRRVVVVPNLLGVSSLGVTAMDLGGILGVEISHRLLFRTPRIIKRFCDFLLSSVGLVVLLPFLLLIAVLIKLTSPGPILFGNRRIGAGGKEFTAWKFRSMCVDAEETLRRVLVENPRLREEWEMDQKIRKDPRVTWVGRILRKTSLDELPQLWNVLRGEMSLVGPRPIIAGLVEKYGPNYSLYCKVRPGISGLWQVSGRNNTTYEERVRLDEYYVRNWSIWLDLYILGKTIKVVLTGDGAY
jgi:Undecaprenyl-phosphate galactose phosphotransferase WbaP